MGPCAVCGGGTIDAAGNCTQCGNYRGTSEAVSGPPNGYPQSSPPYAPTSGSGYNNPYPVSGGAGYPTSPPPAYQPPPSPTPGYTPPPQAYPPVYTPPPPQNKGRRGLNILIGALASVVVVLLCCIGGVVWFTNLPDSDSPTGGGTPTPTLAANPDIDECTVGTWNTTSHVEDLEVPGIGTIKLSGGKGGKLTLADDGTAVMNYGAGTEWTGSVSGQNVRLRIKGPVTYDFTARDGRLTLTGVSTEATYVIYVNGEETAAEEKFLAANDTPDYTCTDTRLTQKGELYTIEYTRA